MFGCGCAELKYLTIIELRDWFRSPHTPSPMSQKQPLELYDIALLLNYERASTEPRFRFTKLHEATTSDFTTFRVPPSCHGAEWGSHAGPKAGFVFVAEQQTKGQSNQEPDLPSNMLPTPVPPGPLQTLTPKQLETIYWQARNHDGCYKSVALIQHFFDLFPDDTLIRVRTHRGVDYTTPVSVRAILEMKLLKPKTVTMCYIPPGRTYTTGGLPVMNHAVMGFGASVNGNIETVLDLASLQFGDAGRGLGGRSTFLMDSLDAFYDMTERVALGADTESARVSLAIGPSPDDAWLKQVARKVKERWEKRETDPWCGHCGAPGKELKKCSACKVVFYCDNTHQMAAWPYHKRYCHGGK